MTTSEEAAAAKQKRSGDGPRGDHERVDPDGIQQGHGVFDLCRAGLPVVRLAPGTNRPDMRGWPDLATSDLRVVTPWLAESPDANWGVKTGGGLGVFDIDTKSDSVGTGGFGSILLLDEFGLDLSACPAVRTASGEHIYFRYEGVLPSRVPLLPHLDLKADGGHQVAGPGTVREVNGRDVTYALTRGDLSAIPTLPRGVVDALRGLRASRQGSNRGGSAGGSGDLPATYEAAQTGLAPGNRNATMHGLACRWWREYGLRDEVNVYALAHRVWERTPQTPAFPWHEAVRAVESARSYITRQVEVDARLIEKWTANFGAR